MNSFGITPAVRKSPTQRLLEAADEMSDGDLIECMEIIMDRLDAQTMIDLTDRLVRLRFHRRRITEC